ncbi:MAG: DUF1206 domain-containing protein [Ilumatobacteraceae bacterium]
MTDDPDTAISWIARVTRFGWLSKGFVFVLIGVLAVRIATTRWAQPDADADQEGALRVVSSQPLGAVLLIIVSIGLIVFMVWNITQAVIRGSTDIDPVGIIKRIGWFGLGVFYGVMASVGLRLAFTEIGSPAAGTQSRSSTGTQGDEGTQAMTARLLDLTGGRFVAIVIALVILVVAGVHLRKGLGRTFIDDINTSDLSPGAEAWLGRLGVGGFVARAFVLAVVAWFLARAAIDFDPNEAVGLDGALRRLASGSYGRVVIVFVGVGMVIAGVYDMVTFRRQQLR